MQQATKRQRGPNYPLVFVEWVDSCATHGWNNPADISKIAKTCFSIGWVIHEDKKILSLASSAGLNDLDKFDSVSGQVTIPQSVIVRRKTLRKGRL